MTKFLEVVFFRNRNACHGPVCVCVFSLLELLPQTNRKKRKQIQGTHWDVPKLTLVTNLSSSATLPVLLCWGMHTRAHSGTHTHTHQACSSTSKTTALLETLEEFMFAQGCLTRTPQQSLSDGMLVSQGHDQGTRHPGGSQKSLRWRARDARFRLPHL